MLIESFTLCLLFSRVLSFYQKFKIHEWCLFFFLYQSHNSNPPPADDAKRCHLQPPFRFAPLQAHQSSSIVALLCLPLVFTLVLPSLYIIFFRFIFYLLVFLVCFQKPVQPIEPSVFTGLASFQQLWLYGCIGPDTRQVFWLNQPIRSGFDNIA